MLPLVQTQNIFSFLNPCSMFHGTTLAICRKQLRSWLQCPRSTFATAPSSGTKFQSVLLLCLTCPAEPTGVRQTCTQYQHDPDAFQYHLPHGPQSSSPGTSPAAIQDPPARNLLLESTFNSSIPHPTLSASTSSTSCASSSSTLPCPSLMATTPSFPHICTMPNVPWGEG